MTRPTPDNLVKMRDTTGQLTELYLAKYIPNNILHGQIFGGQIYADNGDDTVLTFSYINALGDYTKVKAGMTAYINVGRDDRVDLKRVRVKSATSNTVTVAPDSAIEYRQNEHFDIKDYHEFWPVFPRAVLHTGTNEYTLYKDYDIAFADQNTNFNPVVIMGPHFAGFYETFSQIWFSATGSYTVDGSTISSYLWEFPVGASPTGSTLGTPGYITFPSSGHYTVKCTVTASNGKTAVGYRHVILLDKYAGNNLPISDWEFESLEGEWRGGYNLKIKVRNRVDEFKDGDMLILFAENYYQGVEQSFGHPNLDREHIVFIGYINDMETYYDAFDSEVHITVRGISNYMTNKEMFSIAMYDSSAPQDWTEITDLTVNKAINHYLRWHSTLLEMSDFTHIITGEGDYRENIIEIGKGEIFPTLDGLINQRVLGGFSSDSQSSCFAEADYNLIVTGSRFSSVMAFENRDWVGEPHLQERFDTPVSDVLLGGEAYNPPTVTGTAFLSRAPGLMQTYTGKSEAVSGVTLTSQTHINSLAGLLFAKENNRYPELELALSFNMANIETTPQEFYDFDLTGTYRALDWHPRLIPRKISKTFEDFVLKTTITFEPETHGPPGTTVIIPVEVPDDGGNCDEFPEDCDPCPNPPCSDPNPNPVPAPDLVYVAANNFIARTFNFGDEYPTYTNISAGLGGAGTIRDFCLDPFAPWQNAWVVADNGVYRCTNIKDDTPSWSIVISTVDIADNAIPNDVSTTNGRPRRIVGNITSEGLFFVLYTATGVDVYLLGHTHDNGATWHWQTVIEDNLLDVDSPVLEVGQHNGNIVGLGYRYNGFPAGQLSTDGGHTFDPAWFVDDDDTGLTGLLFPWADNPDDDVMYAITSRFIHFPPVSTDDEKIFRTYNQGGITWVDITPPGWISTNDIEEYPYRIGDFTQNRQQIYVSDGTQLFYSNDAGDNWELRSTFGVSSSFGGFPYNDGVFYRTEVAGNILSSVDGGFNWLDKNGDFSSLGTPGALLRIVPDWTEI